jgi:hypothetical protein
MRFESRASLLLAALLAPLWGCEPVSGPTVSRTTFLVSTAASGKQANNPSDFFACVYDDGLKVAFTSSATNWSSISPGPTSTFVKSREDGSIVMAGRNSDAGDTPRGSTSSPGTSSCLGTGGFVVFTPTAFSTTDFRRPDRRTLHPGPGPQNHPTSL